MKSTKENLYEINDWISYIPRNADEAFEGRIVKIGSRNGKATYTVENLMNESKIVSASNSSIKYVRMQLINRSAVSANITTSVVNPDEVRFIRKYWGAISRKAMASLFDISTSFAYKTATKRTMFSIPDGDPSEELVTKLGYASLLAK